MQCYQFLSENEQKKRQIFGIPPEMRLDALFHFTMWCLLRRYGIFRKRSPLQGRSLVETMGLWPPPYFL
ncbi:hypothetical protein Ahy_B02g059334 [Arachis hypogaea]|uniref:Uncharacterized protein n=1 Tax=Arachis hypogaea TaxID=3818 RepID=A0A445AGM1_ARAHY|nr:hypothetical protein Ahy_B02g059334 [Arachis hypogaea]